MHQPFRQEVKLVGTVVASVARANLARLGYFPIRLDSQYARTESQIQGCKKAVNVSRLVHWQAERCDIIVTIAFSKLLLITGITSRIEKDLIFWPASLTISD